MSNSPSGGEILSQVTIFSKYARYIPSLGRRENWNEIVDRTVSMHCKKYPKIEKDIASVFDTYVRPKLVLPSMRSLQFGGKPIELFPNRLHNCCALPIDNTKAFREIMFLLMGGTGVGYSVQHNHIKKLPAIKKPIGVMRYVVQDSIIGWAEAVDMLMKAYFYGERTPEFDFGDIRSRGTLLKTSGGRAPGPEELAKSLESIRTILDSVTYGNKLSSLQCHDICCHIAAAVLSGGIRRAAMISLFDFDDEEMLQAKTDNWLETHPNRQYANNSVMALRYKLRKKDLLECVEHIHISDYGEPGLCLANDYNTLYNPCMEVSVSLQFCNLTTFDMPKVESNEDLKELAQAAAFIGTLQAGYTNFVYLRPIWQEKTEEEALLGVSCTGVARKDLTDFDFVAAAEAVKNTNKEVAKKIGIRPAYRTTANKPEGSSSAVLNTSSGVHAWHSEYGIRRTRYMYDEPIARYFEQVAPDLLEIEKDNPKGRVLSLPFCAPENAITRSQESAFDLLERVKFMSLNWVRPGHIKGHNGHSVSATVSVKENEWNDVAEWMWRNRNDYNGISLLPYDGGQYEQPPFEEITKERYNQMTELLPKNINLDDIKEREDNTTHSYELSCANGACQLD